MPSPNFRILSMVIVIAALGLAHAWTSASPARSRDSDYILLALLLVVFVPWVLEIVFPVIKGIFLRLVHPRN